MSSDNAPHYDVARGSGLTGEVGRSGYMVEEELYKKKREIERKTLHLLTEYDNQTKLEAAIKQLKKKLKQQ